MIELLRASSKGPKFFHARSFVLRQNLLTDFSMNVGEAKVLALEAVGELFVVEAKEMEESRVEVVDVDFSIDYAEATARNLLLEESP